MKKLLSTMAALTLLSTTATTVIACSNKNMEYYNQFMDGINNKKTFIFMISAEDCPHCKNTVQTTIPELYANGRGTQMFTDYLTGVYGANYALSTYNVSAEDQTNMKESQLFITSDVENYSKVWSEKWATKILNWVVTQERNAHKINGEIDKTITADSLGIKGTPAYIYIKNGNYVGFENGEIGNLTDGPNANLWMQYFIKHIVQEDWDTNHNPSS